MGLCFICLLIITILLKGCIFIIKKASFFKTRYLAIDEYKVRLKENDPEDLIRTFSEFLHLLLRISFCIDRKEGKVKREELDKNDLSKYLFLMTFS